MTPAPSAFATYLAHWRHREPEMQFADPFVPPGLRPRFRAWGSTLAQLEHSAFGPSDAQVAVQRLAWWGQQLAEAQPQHPVAQELAAAGVAPGTLCPLADALLTLAQDERSPPDTAAALAALAPYARTVAAAEAALFGGQPSGPAADAVATGSLARWVAELPAHALLRERLPLHLLARHAPAEGTAPERAIAIDLARELLPHAPPGAGLPLYRALRWRYDRIRLRRMAAGTMPRSGRPVPGPLRATFIAWSAARNASPASTPHTL